MAGYYHYQIYLQLNDIDHSKTKVKSPQLNGICERFHQTVINEFYRVTFRKKIYSDINSFQNDLDKYIIHCNQERTHQGKRCQGKTPILTFEHGKEGFYKKNIDSMKTVA